MAKLRRSAFVSYAHADAPLVDPFLELLRLRCTNLRDVEIDNWSDARILVGERWEEAINAAIEASDFGLLCVTQAFLASEFVTAEELPALLARDVVIPVLLEPLDLALTDLKGLDELQLFRHRRPGTREPKAFAEFAGQNRGRFCDALVAQMVARLTTSPRS